MPRAHRHFLSDHVWHITHRCHQQTFLLKFTRDRRHYLRLLFEAKKRFGLCVLNYMVTFNHVHPLVKGAEAIGFDAGHEAFTREGNFQESPCD